MKSPSRPLNYHGSLALLIFAGALGCAPAVNIGSLPEERSNSLPGAGLGSPADAGPEEPTCGVTTLASALDQPWAVTMHGDSVYVATGGATTGSAMGNGSVMRVPLAGGAPVALATTPGITLALASDASNVYWSVFVQTGVPSTLIKVPVGGGPLTEVAEGLDVSALALDAANLYWVTGDGTVKKAPLQGGAATTLASVPGGSAGHSVVADTTNVYWISNEGIVRKVPIGGGAPTIIASGNPTPYGIVVDATNVYWMAPSGSPNSGHVLKAPIDGSAPPEALASASGSPLALPALSSFVINDGYIYLFGVEGLTRVPVLGGDPEVIAANTLTYPDGIVACPGGVCWSDGVHGTLMRFEACSR